MSDTSILTAIKYKGKMIRIPQDTSTQGSGVSIKYLTQAQYNALHTKDPNTLYLIEESV